MRINNNLMAMNTHRQMGITAGSQTKSMEKLSSGYRINRAGDDAAGLAISEKMRAQIRGLNQASRNSQDGISLIQTAEGALNETQNILQRMRELAVQSANDTNVSADRTAIQNEIDQLTQEIDRIGDTTEFNTRKLLNGGASVQGTIGAGADSAVTIIGGTGDTKAGTAITFTGGITAGTKASLTITSAATATSSSLSAVSSLTLDGVAFNFSTTDTIQDVVDSINSAGINVVATAETNGDITLASNSEGSGQSFTVNVDGVGGLADATAATVIGTDASFTELTGVSGLSAYEAKGNTITVLDGNAKGLSFSVDQTVAAAAASSVTVTSNGTLSLQIGANEGQEMSIGLSDMRADALSVGSVDISTAATAKTAITTINDAITSVSTERAKLGAFQNRLEHTISNLDTSAENLQASESRIRDVDMAKEMMEFTKNNILQQAAQSMLAQANQAPQGVLQLLR
jgi:flagellin